MLGVWLITLEAITIGATNVLLPLRLAGLGASGVAIGATFLLAAGFRALVAPFVGRVSDRRGTAVPIGVGLSLAVLFMIALPLSRSALALAAVSVLALGGPLACLIPAASLVTDAAERVGIGLAAATMLFNLAYAIGETIGAPAAAGLAQVTSDAVPFVVLAALMLPTLFRVFAQGRRYASSARPNPAPSTIQR